MTEKIAGTKIHRDYGRRGSGAPYYFQKALLWTVLILTALSLLYLVPALIRRARGTRAP